ncbi:acetyl-CoA synthetase-like protein, partial [Glonium stellatum]
MENSDLEVARNTDIVSWTFSSLADGLDKPLLIDPSNESRWLSYNQARTHVRKLIRGLKTLGIQPGDCVCLDSFNDILYNILILGIIGAGARFTGVNPSYTVHEVAHHLRMTKPKLVIVEPPMLNTALTAAELYGLPRSAVLVFDEHEANPYSDLKSWNILLSHGESEFERVPDPTTTVAAYFTTSGTSGLPKAAMISHSYLVAQAAFHCEKAIALPYPVRRLTHGPPFHSFSTPIVPSSIRSNYPIYIMRRYNEANFLTSISRFQITETYMPPAILTSLPNSPLCTPENMSSIKQIWVGGASAPLKSRLPLYAKLSPAAQINVVWGLTEIGWVTTAVWPEKLLDDSVGRPLP